MAKKRVERSLELLQAQGFHAAIVERWNHFDKAYAEAFGFISLIAMRPGEKGILGIHMTPDPEGAARKLLEDRRAKNWLQSGNRIEIHEWHKEPEPEVDPKYWKWVVQTQAVSLKRVTKP
jgi:hypothetical protein